ncbi:MAG: leucine-rich repeat domain-containing protein [Crocinitomicaceae bacterium]|nr:leucine-rich repeat domain-containing protein [Crocinitomicaceae bacterium]
MKFLSAIILFLVCNCANGQSEGFVIYKWKDLPSTYNSDTIFGISFSKMKLDTVPKGLSKFKNLKHLDLSKNKLDQLPNFIGDMGKITFLSLEKNKFTSMPNELCRMKNIEHLILSRNLLRTLPSCIEYLKAVKYIDLYDNPISSLPDSFERMQNLEKIDLSGIRFSANFQDSWQQRLPNVKFIFDNACDCMK